jgi:hypothetical protein
MGLGYRRFGERWISFYLSLLKHLFAGIGACADVAAKRTKWVLASPAHHASATLGRLRIVWFGRGGRLLAEFGIQPRLNQDLLPIVSLTNEVANATLMAAHIANTTAP